MVVRRGKEKRRGIHPGVEKQKIKCKVVPTVVLHGNAEGGKFLGIREYQLGRVTEASFNLVSRLVCALAILPMEYQCGRLVMTSSKWKQLVHYLVHTALLGCLVSKAVIVFSFLAEHGLTVKSVLCVVSLIPLLWGVTLGSGNIFKHQETLQLVNSWKSTLECLGAAKGNPVSLYTSLSASLKAVASVAVNAGFVVILLVFPFTFPDLPVHVHSVVLSSGLKSFAPPLILVQLVCLPLELFLAAAPLLSYAFSILVLIIGIDVLKVYYDGIRWVTQAQLEISVNSLS